MDIKDAIKKIKESPDFSKLEGKTLCSAIAFTNKDNDIDKWELNYYDGDTKKINRVVVSDVVELFPENSLFKEDSAVSQINENDIVVTTKDALKIAMKHNETQYKQQAQKMFIALHAGKTPHWSINIITNVLSVIQIKISAKTGKIIESKTHNLFQGKGVAS
ncbi:MAG: hypothetical protein KAI53_01625 [Candidatus Aenigmarchaeota archaeon]|nr:hypothetical protein [Candidatus Aenigmarchaeota archaeon]